MTEPMIELEISESNLIQAFRRLSAQRRVELLNKLETLCEPELRPVPARRLRELTGVISLGGNALTDTEAIFDGDNGD